VIHDVGRQLAAAAIAVALAACERTVEYTIEGDITSESSGAPIADIAVECTKAGAADSVAGGSGSNGHYLCEFLDDGVGDEDPQTIDVAFEDEDGDESGGLFRRASRRVQLRAHEPMTLDVALVAAAE
jgi:hypothetical protein